MTLLRLGICVAGVYSMFLLWAIAQERLSVPFASTNPNEPPERFRSVLFLNTLQSLASVISSAIYIWIRRIPGQSLSQTFGLVPHTTLKSGTNGASNGHANGKAGLQQKGNPRLTYARDLLLRCLQCAVFVSTAAPFGFAALSHISYPTMVLGKSCKLIPVMIMNLLLYRRKFAPHKYLVVALVTIGITVFMGLGDSSAKGGKHKGNAQSSLWGIFLLLINLIIDGATNSTQDEIFVRYRITGQQMMFWLNAWSTLLTSTLIALPLPHVPILNPITKSTVPGQSELQGALSFIRTHPDLLKPLMEFSITGSLGQLFIFETLEHFGSLTLVTVTLTRKLFTMILSVVVYNHKLTYGQWLGAGIVFAGIGVEAWVKRKEIHAKRVIKEQEKAKLKVL